MSDAPQTYLRKKTCFDQWPLIAADTAGIEHVVAIPALAEYEHLFDTLNDLAANAQEALARTLVICVVNNRAAPYADAADIENNLQTLERLKTRAKSNAGVRLAYVDAASAGKELPPKDGVGLARKIGLDWGLAILHQNGRPNGGLIALDADTRVDKDYLAAAQHFFQSEARWAAVFDYAHPLDDPRLASAIVRYELFLRYHVLGLEYAGSPYAFPTIGSAMACTARAYAAVSGMNRRQAGEDFYFLQQLAKTGPVERIPGATVHPSARPSHRVPFGTGARIQKCLENPDEEILLYAPESYVLLKQWLSSIPQSIDAPAETVLQQAARIAPEWRNYLDLQGFAEIWPRLQAQNRDPGRFLRQFHAWFDAFQTVKIFHYLRDHGRPDQEMFSALRTLLQYRGDTLPEGAAMATPGYHGAQYDFLVHLRQA